MNCFICACAALTVALNTNTDKARAADTLWKHCDTVEVSAVVLDTASNLTELSGLWVQAGDQRHRQLFGPRVKTDRTGEFHLKVDPKHTNTAVYIFIDSSATDVNQNIASFGLGFFVNNLSMHGCESDSSSMTLLTVAQ